MDIAQREKEAEVKLVAPDVLVASELDTIAAAKAVSGGEPEEAKTRDEKPANKPSEAPAIEGVELPKNCKLPDNYRVLEKVGEGGMGQVFRVEDQALKQQLAVKMMNPQYIGDQTARKRFEKEAAAAGDLTHANIAQVYNCSTEGDSPYILMEFVDGISFAQLLKQERKLDEQRLITICLQICDALDYAHRRGIVHRDLKPSNIILKQPGDMVKIVDFGIAKLASEKGGATQLTQKGEVFGSPQYMSPEQAKGALVDYRADLYSLGCIMYEALAGQPLFAGDNSVQILLQHINASIKPYMSILLNKGCSASMVTIIRKLLEKDQSLRYQSAEELSRDLWRVLERKRPKSLTNMRYLFDMPIFIKTKALVCGALSLLLVAAFIQRDAISRAVGLRNPNQQFIDANGVPNRVMEAKQLVSTIDSGDEAAAEIAVKELVSIIVADSSGAILERSAQDVLIKSYARYKDPEIKEDIVRLLSTFPVPSDANLNFMCKVATDGTDAEKRRILPALQRWVPVLPKSTWPMISLTLIRNLNDGYSNSWQIAGPLREMNNRPDETVALVRKKYKQFLTTRGSVRSTLREILLKRAETTGEYFPELMIGGSTDSLIEVVTMLGPKSTAYAPALIAKLHEMTEQDEPPVPKSAPQLNDSPDGQRLSLLTALGDVGPIIGHQAIPVLADAVTNWHNVTERVGAAFTISKLGPEGKAPLEKLAKSRDPLTAYAAKQGLKNYQKLLKEGRPPVPDGAVAPVLQGATTGTIGPTYHYNHFQ